MYPGTWGASRTINHVKDKRRGIYLLLCMISDRLYPSRPCDFRLSLVQRLTIAGPLLRSRRRTCRSNRNLFLSSKPIGSTMAGKLYAGFFVVVETTYFVSWDSSSGTMDICSCRATICEVSSDILTKRALGTVNRRNLLTALYLHLCSRCCLRQNDMPVI